MAKAFRHVDLVIHVDHAVIDLDVCIVEIERGARKVLAYACSAAVLRVLLILLTACLPRRLEVVAMPLACFRLRLLIQLEALGYLAAAGLLEADRDLEAGLGHHVELEVIVCIEVCQHVRLVGQHEAQVRLGLVVHGVQHVALVAQVGEALADGLGRVRGHLAEITGDDHVLLGSRLRQDAFCGTDVEGAGELVRHLVRFAVANEFLRAALELARANELRVEGALLAVSLDMSHQLR